MGEIIWQPVGLREARLEFGILLEETLAREMIRMQVPGEVQENLNKFAANHLARFDMEWKSPVHFYENSIFAEGFYLGGTRLEIASHSTREDLLKENPLGKPARYSSGNVDSAEQRSALLNLFDLWINHASSYTRFHSK